MIAVIFEVWPADDDRRGQYLDIAASLRGDLSKIEGFLSIERFQSLADPGKLLSLSFWRDEEAVREWRNLPSHRVAQGQGRKGVFENYRLRVVSIMRDYGLDDRIEAPEDSRSAHAV
ncbi:MULTISPECIES: antibiotic biosynthesis monooxygenase family protein [Brucella/Ochrobactrum group]|jgi:heme-degrading monooxygenase HmoA|uniref:Antibiotic biosynthesis monooxygenase n=1 Tax=Brucella pseudintermedia TaxID=370111 RepID=A0ABY5UC18_9HYPH|nr:MULTISPECIES: antibiotic biosynthesis monooxygenase [Brucella/Ochrobactrum group]KAB2683891.1 antibiotic biosynthesis monooxygenase [Brucella pseudintermedia]MCO7727748.1 antibiotic biosynthesis monooxygenase [Brucella intermedia]NKE77072.1 antibiotic biosynthesis monooxygenase [Ochrobactrum sp. MC-1LL]TWH03816.1 heme-degrading monooxygenase HmoA [Ochrobactrum sp. J50]UWL60880.1 antibiotic biosynthesis monooxygenase [Brucella pseudintermedia]